MKQTILTILLCLFLVSTVTADVFIIYSDTQTGRYTLDVTHFNQSFINSLTNNENVTIDDNSTIYITVRQGRFDIFANPTLLFDWILDNGVAFLGYFFLFGIVTIILKGIWKFLP